MSTPADPWLSASVAGQAQGTISAIGVKRLAAPFPMAAASARGCPKGGEGWAATLLYLSSCKCDALTLTNEPTIVYNHRTPPGALHNVTTFS